MAPRERLTTNRHGSGSLSALALALALGLAVAGCGGATPSAACGLGGTADQAAFDRSFTSMTLVDGAGNPGSPDPEAGVDFPAAARMIVQVEALAATEVRFCVAVRDAGATIAVDRTEHLPAGAGQVDLGTFSSRAYVIRVGVAGTLVRNLAFTIR
jgi:hypothetical protein